MTTRFNELELAELEAYMPIRVMDRTVGPLLRRAPRLIAVARLANEQAERIAELEATLGCYRDGSDWPAGMREKFSENRLAERESTIERLTTEQADTATLFSSMTRRAAQMEDERDAAQDRLAAASVLLDRIFLDLGDVPDNWRALRAELDGR